MADINVEKKKNIWPWIIGVIVILGVVIFLFVWNDDEEESNTNVQQLEQYEDETTNTPTLDYPENEVGTYLALIDRGYDENPGQFTGEAMGKLVQATEYKSYQLQIEPDTDLQKMAEDSTAMNTKGELSISENEFQQAGQAVVDNLRKMQENSFDELSDEVDQLSQDLQEVQNSQGEDRSEAVTDFFEQAADVLRAMSLPQEDTHISRPLSSADTAGYSTDVDTIETEK